MSSNRTPNYSLNQWVKSDRVLMEEFNADNVKIDAALNNLSAGLAGKASASALSSLQGLVNSKASQSDLDALKTTVNGKASTSALNSLKSTVTSLQTAVNKKQDSAGAVRLVRGSYTGTGSSGDSSPLSLSFASSLGKLPELLVVRAVNGGGEAAILLQGMETSMKNLSGSIGSGSRLAVSWNASAKTVTLTGDNPSAQFNVSGTKYYYFAIA